jgi:hypothetical protein
MRLLLEGVSVGHHEVRLEGSPAILEKLAQNDALKWCAEGFSFLHRDGVPEWTKERTGSCPSNGPRGRRFAAYIKA